jgi:hypothetical protein
MMMVKAVLCRGGLCVSERPCPAARGVGIGQAADCARVWRSACHEASTAKPPRTVACVDAWIEDFRKDIRAMICPP